jgi:lipopolysaccharide O-acetyltransferase
MKIYNFLKKVYVFLFQSKRQPEFEVPNLNPYEINFGQNSVLAKPMQIDGGSNIFIGNNTSIGHGAWLAAFSKYITQTFSPKLIIGDNVRIGNYACITSINSINIGDGCLFSEYVYISDHSHGIDVDSSVPPAFQPLASKGAVEIGENTFLGFRVCILPGVKLGKNCVVGANAVVTKSFPDYTMLAGVPAKAIKKYSLQNKMWIDVND